VQNIEHNLKLFTQVRSLLYYYLQEQMPAFRCHTQQEILSGKLQDQ